MKKLVLLVCLAFCASSFAQSTASVAQTADEKKMIFQIQPVTDSSAQDQSYNEGAEVDLSVWNHQKDKKKDKSLNWTVAEIKKAQESAVKTNSNLTKEQEILKDVSIPKTRTLADNLNKALNDFINIDGSSLNTPGNAFHIESTPDGKTALYY
ncbi:MAG: hypothetical protein J6Y94_05195, partial [Bacteriovoracaceae bacterium]|nr:hypothetical protein [Bacteriovoracaceae bacterium]